MVGNGPLRAHHPLGDRTARGVAEYLPLEGDGSATLGDGLDHLLGSGRAQVLGDVLRDSSGDAVDDVTTEVLPCRSGKGLPCGHDGVGGSFLGSRLDKRPGDGLRSGVRGHLSHAGHADPGEPSRRVLARSREKGPSGGHQTTRHEELRHESGG